MQRDSRIFIAGHNGMVGSAIERNLRRKDFLGLLTRSRERLDLTDQNAVSNFFEKEQPEYVIDAAAKVGGIQANNRFRADFIHQNLAIQNNLIHASWKYGVKKLLFLGSSCIYPRDCPQPIREEYLLTGPLEPTNEPYAIAKIAGIKLCESYFRQYGCNFISLMPTNLYGPNDNFDFENSHVLPAMVRKMYLARCLESGEAAAIRTDLTKWPVPGFSAQQGPEQLAGLLEPLGISADLTLWGSGNVFREFMHVDDLAEACVFAMEHIEAEEMYNNMKVSHLNAGTGEDILLSDLAQRIREITGFKGNIRWDTSRPDGTPKKLLDVSRLKSLGWKPVISLNHGIAEVFYLLAGKP